MSRPARPGVREEILEAARAEFGRCGLDRARVEDIARRAGISKGAFYLHFPTKEAALQEILQRFLGAMDSAVARRGEAEGGFLDGLSPKDPDLLEHLVAYEAQSDVEFLEALWQHRGLLAALDGAGGSEFPRIIDEFRRRLRAFIASHAAARQRIGVLRSDVSASVIGDIVFGAYEAFGRHMGALREKPDLLAWARQLHRVLYDGMLDRSPQPRAGRRTAKSRWRVSP